MLSLVLHVRTFLIKISLIISLALILFPLPGADPAAASDAGPATAAPAQSDDGVSYGAGVEHLDNRRIPEAIAAFRQAAAAGDLRAQVALADLVLADLVPGMAPDQAVALFQDAAARGDPVAQLNIGDFYARGVGLPQDPVKAWVWLSRAAAQGRVWAALRRDQLGRDFSPQQRAAAKRQLESQP
tara:strand:+ start:629 stop:1183 length:555 start_codon:yes stop_codon:yes gene_type:complete